MLYGTVLMRREHSGQNKQPVKSMGKDPLEETGGQGQGSAWSEVRP